MSVHADTDSRESDGTRIKVSGETAEDLYDRKGRRETYEDVIRRLLRRTEGSR